ncbi:MAG: hypothetical protein ACR2NW_06505 [Thermodesulfobacteriota bacterium]
MSKLFLTLILLGVATTYIFADEYDKGLICKNNEVTVITKNQEECRSINGVIHTNFLFVINFNKGSYDGKTLLVNGNNGSNVLYFLERPYMEAGHIGVNKFKILWANGSDKLNTSDPNATLSIFSEDGEENIILTLANPSIKNNSISFEAKLIEGNLPGEFSNGGLFMESTIAGVCPGCVD